MRFLGKRARNRGFFRRANHRESKQNQAGPELDVQPPERRAEVPGEIVGSDHEPEKVTDEHRHQNGKGRCHGWLPPAHRMNTQAGCDDRERNDRVNRSHAKSKAFVPERLDDL